MTKLERYQSHGDTEKGMSDSALKLKRLRLPSDMRGLRVLDIGCNEGYFCSVAVDRGATDVIGIDVDVPALTYAREKYGHLGIKFVQQHWSRLPDGSFDLVLWTSAMHYELDPYPVLEAIHDRLRPGGMLVLECGVIESSHSEMAAYQRHSDTRWYPTTTYLHKFLLRDYSVRHVTQPYVVDGDPIPRSVFHCAPLRTTVLIVQGDTQEGKTTLTRLIDPPKTVSIDHLLARIAVAKWHHTPLQQFVKDKYGPNGLGYLLREIDASGLNDALAQFIAEGIAVSDRLVVVEGALTNGQVAALKNVLGGRAIVWEANRTHMDGLQPQPAGVTSARGVP